MNLPEPPEVPRNFTILQDSETTSSIRFAWFPGFHGGANQTFYIECKPKGQEWRDCARLSGGKLNRQFQLTVDGLASGSSYLFRIYSKNEYGNSTDKSITLLGKTTNEEGSFFFNFTIIINYILLGKFRY